MLFSLLCLIIGLKYNYAISYISLIIGALMITGLIVSLNKDQSLSFMGFESAAIGTAIILTTGSAPYSTFFEMLILFNIMFWLFLVIKIIKNKT